MEELTSPEAPAETPSPAPAADAPAPVETAPESAADKAAASDKALHDDLAKVYRNANRERTEDGKFASKDGKPAPVEAEQQAEPAKTEAPQPEQPKAPAVPPPHSWSKEAKAEWDKLPPTLQQHIAQREADSHKAISQLGQFAKGMEPVANVLNEHADRIRSSGLDAGTYLANVMRADMALNRDPVGFIKQVADYYKIDTASLFDPLALPSSDPQSLQLNSQLNAAWQEIDNLKRQLEDTRYRVEGREAQEYQARQSEFEGVVTAFSADKPDFSSLVDDIEINISQLKRSNPGLSPQDILQQAYDRARWANPATRQQLIAEQTAKQEAARLEEAKKAAANAKRAAGINVNGSVPGRVPASLDDDLRSIWRRANAS